MRTRRRAAVHPPSRRIGLRTGPDDPIAGALDSAANAVALIAAEVR